MNFAVHFPLFDRLFGTFHLPADGRWVEVLNTDSTYYGGSDVGNLGGVEAEPDGWHDQPFSAEVTLPPLSVCWFVPEMRG